MHPKVNIYWRSQLMYQTNNQITNHFESVSFWHSTLSTGSNVLGLFAEVAANATSHACSLDDVSFAKWTTTVSWYWIFLDIPSLNGNLFLWQKWFTERCKVEQNPSSLETDERLAGTICPKWSKPLLVLVESTDDSDFLEQCSVLGAWQKRE